MHSMMFQNKISVETFGKMVVLMIPGNTGILADLLAEILTLLIK